jgi:predicted regulator of Ras-like GTPase activity (Roadblock/LC7/MglB family)
MSKPLLLSPQQHAALRHELSQLSGETGITCAMLLDMNGQPVAQWARWGTLDFSAVAGIVAGDMAAALEIGSMVGGRGPCKVIIQEHDDKHVLCTRVDRQLLLLLVTGRDVPLGWARMTARQTSATMATIVARASVA